MLVKLNSSIWLISFYGWFNREHSCHLANCVWTQLDGFKFIELIIDLTLKIMSFEPSSSESAFSHQSLWNWVQWKKFNTVSHLSRLLSKYFSEAMELDSLLVNIVLIDLISHYKNLVLIADVNDLRNVILCQNLSSRISWINHNNTSNVDAIPLGFSNCLPQFLSIKSPVLALIEIVVNLLATIKSNQCRIERVLGNWDQYAIIWVSN